MIFRVFEKRGEKRGIAFTVLRHFYLFSVTSQLLRVDTSILRSFSRGKRLVFSVIRLLINTAFRFGFYFSFCLLPCILLSFVLLELRSFCGCPWLLWTCVYDLATCEHLLRPPTFVQLHGTFWSRAFARTALNILKCTCQVALFATLRSIR